MRDILRKGILITTIAAMGAATFTGCGNKQKSKEATNKKVQKVIVGSGTSYNPYCYLDENGKATGYEYAVLKEVDKLLPQYEFEYKSMNFDSLLLSLESKKIDMAAHQYEYTKEREQKYLFGKEAYTTYVTYIAVLKNDNKTKSLEDLAGQKIRSGGSTSATATILKEYNEKHKDKAVKIITAESTDEEVAAALKSGTYKAAILTKRDVEKYNKNYGNGKDFLKIVGEPINNSKTYYLYRKDENKLQKAVDGALKKLKESGKLSKLSTKYIGGDFTESE